jgi:hypothetical protein
MAGGTFVGENLAAIRDLFDAGGQTKSGKKENGGFHDCSPLCLLPLLSQSAGQR